MRGWWLGMGLSLLLGLVGCGTAPPTPTLVPPPAPTPTITPPSPTALPPALSPTALPRPPTALPTVPPALPPSPLPATATPTPALPTVTAAPPSQYAQLSPASRAYVDNARAWQAGYDHALGDLTFLDTHRRIDADTWATELAGDVAALDALNGAVRDTPVPPALAPLGQAWQRAGQRVATLVQALQAEATADAGSWPDAVSSALSAAQPVYQAAVAALAPYAPP